MLPARGGLRRIRRPRIGLPRSVSLDSPSEEGGCWTRAVSRARSGALSRVRPAFVGGFAVARPRREELQKRIIDLVEPLLVHEGYELVEVEIVGSGPGMIVRLYIDKPGGVTLDDCASVSEAVDPMLDVEDPIESAYTLEVSSPGLDRPLRKPEDFNRFAGSKVKVKTYGPLPGAGNRKVFVGTLRGLADDAVQVEIDGTSFAIPRTDVAKAHLVYEFDDGKPKGKRR